MKTTLFILIACMLLVAPPASAQEQKPGQGAYVLETPFDGDVGAGYRDVNQKGSPMAGEYEYLKSSLAADAVIEYDPLPNRILFELFMNNTKDYHGEFDYSYGDIVMFNGLARKLYRNMRHLSLGEDDPATASPSFTDYDPEDEYYAQVGSTSGRIRLKTPDFPLHVYLEAKNQEEHNKMQVRFLESFSGGMNKASRTRDVDYETNEVKATVNSHLGPVEVEYIRAQKTFEEAYDKVMTDTVPGTTSTYVHHLVPEIESSSDTFKVHTSHTGRVAASATYSSGEKENKDSGAQAAFVNAAGDLTLIPWRDLTVSVKYRHYEVDPDSPATITAPTFGGATATYDVRQSIASTRDQVSGMVRFRVTDRLVMRAEYAWENLLRDVWPGYDTLPSGDPAYWTLDQRVTKSTGRLGATYRLTNRLMLRGDVSRQTADHPEGSVDNTYPDTSDAARATVSWMPASWFNVLVSGGTVREQIDQLGAPFSGSRSTEGNRALGSFTFLVGKKTSITPSYAFFQNKVSSAVAVQDATTGAMTAETDVPYADVTHLGAIAVAYALNEVVTLSAEAGRAYSRGQFRVSQTVPGTTEIAELSDLKTVDTTATAEVRVQLTKYLGGDLRYRFRKIDDILDETQDGTMQIVYAGMRLAW